MKNRNKISLEKPEIDYSSWFIELGALTLFTRKVLNQFFKPPFEHGELIKQGYYIGYKTLPLISITGFIMGLVLTIQIRPILVDFGATSLLPGLIAVAFVREVGPVITGLLCSGKISSGIAAEIGAMKVSEQIDAMEVSGTKPLGFVVATRVLATTLLVPLLVIVGDAFSFFGFYSGTQHGRECYLQSIYELGLRYHTLFRPDTGYHQNHILRIFYRTYRLLQRISGLTKYRSGRAGCQFSRNYRLTYYFCDRFACGIGN